MTLKGHPRSKKSPYCWMVVGQCSCKLFSHWPIMVKIGCECVQTSIHTTCKLQYHKGPNWTFLTFKMTFRETAHLIYFRTALTSLHGYIYIYLLKWAKSDLSDLEKGPLERFKETLPGKLYAKIEKKLLNCFGSNSLRVQKGPNVTFPTLKNYL